MQNKDNRNEMNKIKKATMKPTSKTSTVTGVGLGSYWVGNPSSLPKENHIFLL